MRRRRGSPMASAFRNPTVIGALTVLITILAVFLAYNANNGLPFVQTYRLTAQVPDAAALVPGNEVRVGGVRVGVIEAIEPVTQEDGSINAALSLKLDKVVEPLPVDSTVIIRSRSALGLKYVQIVRGTDEEGYEEGAVLPLSAAKPEPVEFDELLNTFDEPTRVAMRENLYEFGNALAGRGVDLNEAIGAFEPLLPRLERVMHILSDRQSGIGPFFAALEQSAAPIGIDQSDRTDDRERAIRQRRDDDTLPGCSAGSFDGDGYPLGIGSDRRRRVIADGPAASTVWQPVGAGVGERSTWAGVDHRRHLVGSGAGEMHPRAL